MDRFGGTMGRADIEAVKAEYDANGGADADILFAFHALDAGGKAAFLSMLTGLLLSDDNLQAFNGIEKARDVTLERLSGQREALRKG